MPAKLPAKHIAPPERYVRDLAIGEESHTLFIEMKIDAEGFCYLNPDAALGFTKTYTTIAVRRDASGYHVTAPASIIWRRGAEGFLKQEFYPVETFTEE